MFQPRFYEKNEQTSDIDLLEMNLADLWKDFP